MVTHSNILAWRIPWTEEPVGLQSMESQRVRPNRVTKQQQLCSQDTAGAHSLKAPTAAGGGGRSLTR